MDVVKMVFSGIGILILVYLLVANADGFSKILSTGGSTLTSESKVLQGR
jgi:hypothetical protein